MVSYSVNFHDLIPFLPVLGTKQSSLTEVQVAVRILPNDFLSHSASAIYPCCAVSSAPHIKK